MTTPAASIPTDLVELYVGQGLSLANLAARYGHTPDWVRVRLVAAGVPLRGRERRSAISDQQVREMLNEGLRVAEIASQLRVSETTVLDRMRTHGWTGPPRRPRGPSRKAPPPPSTEALRQLYVQDGLTVAEVAEQLNLSTGRVAAALKDAGIVPRRPGWTDGRPPAPITLEQLTTLYVDQGRSVDEVADELATTSTRVTAALRRHGIPRRPEPRATPPPLALDRTTLTELYVNRRLDDPAIGELHGVPAYRVTLRRRELGVRRPAALPPHPQPPGMPAPDDLRRWYVDESRTLVQIARQHHTTQARVRTWLQTAGVSVQPRTSRAHRKQLDPDRLRELYVTREWSAGLIAAELNTSVQQVLRTLHDNGIPVRRGGQPSRRHPDATLERLAALYDDPEIAALLRRHDIPQRPATGTITERFPTPVPISEAFLVGAYVEIGLATGHIEQLTGQPAERVLHLLHEHGIEVRVGGASPWLRRQR